MVRAYYLDTSVAGRALLKHSESAAAWLDETDAEPTSVIVSSRLLQTEITRMLRRESLPVLLREQLLIGVNLVPISESILRSAEAIGEHVKTLDAIHLATAMSIDGEVIVVTHDKHMASVAASLGMAAFDPVND